MMSFLKNFLAGEKSPEEKAIIAAQAEEKSRDVLTLDAYAMDEDEAEEEEGNCAPPAAAAAPAGVKLSGAPSRIAPSASH